MMLFERVITKKTVIKRSFSDLLQHFSGLLPIISLKRGLTMIVSDIKELIGKTPIFQFSATDYGGQDQSRIYAKLEYLNPGGSVKDRLGHHLITKGIAAGRITKDTTVIEPTAGNTGIGLALAGLAYGLEMIFVIPDTFSQEKQQLIKALGARIIHSPGLEGMQGAIEKAKLLAAQLPNSF
jgi:cysteine synthase A